METLFSVISIEEGGRFLSLFSAKSGRVSSFFKRERRVRPVLVELFTFVLNIHVPCEIRVTKSGLSCNTFARIYL